MKDDGRSIEDDLLVNLLLKRIQLKDCFKNGFILEDFPKTRESSNAFGKARSSTLSCNKYENPNACGS